MVPSTGALVVVEVLRLVFKSSEIERKHEGRSPLTGHYVSRFICDGRTSSQEVQKRAHIEMVVAAVVALIAFARKVRTHREGRSSSGRDVGRRTFA